jgi:protein gp37
MGKTKIEWTATHNADGSVTPGATWNPIRARTKEDFVVPAGKWGYHCEHISPGCKNCYAESMNGRTLPAWGTGLKYNVPNREKIDIFLDEKELLKPLSWKRPRKVFVCSMTDLFADFVPDDMILDVFRKMAQCPSHTFQVLTKRADRMQSILSRRRWRDLGGGHCVSLFPDEHREDDLWFLPNVWLGVSCENQEWADKRIPWLLKTPAEVRFLSVEPMLGPVDLNRIPIAGIGEEYDPVIHANVLNRASALSAFAPHVNWVIVGGESGHGARPMNPQWVRDIRDQCVNAGVAFFFKQMCNQKGRKIPFESVPEDLKVRELPNA